ncbi:MAG: hypothetical protein U0V75_08475 [Ferruginibacter sp.]
MQNHQRRNFLKSGTAFTASIPAVLLINTPALYQNKNPGISKPQK